MAWNPYDHPIRKRAGGADGFLTDGQVKEIEEGIRRSWAAVEACPYRDPEDGCCAHPNNLTPECNGIVCPLMKGVTDA